MARLTKWEIARKIEQLPGTQPWDSSRFATNYIDMYTREELINWHNSIIARLDLSVEPIN